MPQLLLIDIGNTRAKWATARLHGKIQVQGELVTRDLTLTRIRKLAAEFPEHRAILACVVPRLAPYFERVFGRRLHIVRGAHPALTLPFKYPHPAEVGADRIAVALAAYADGHWPAIIVSCGTATAVTVLNSRGQLCGGMIAPGLQTQLRALLVGAAQLPDTSLRPPKSPLATSTAEAIRAGVFLSFQGGVREMIARVKKSLPTKPVPRILLTGGDAHHLVDTLGREAQVRPLLVFEGLRIMGARIFSATVS